MPRSKCSFFVARIFIPVCWRNYWARLQKREFEKKDNFGNKFGRFLPPFVFFSGVAVDLVLRRTPSLRSNKTTEPQTETLASFHYFCIRYALTVSS